MSRTGLSVVEADWSHPSVVRAMSTTRHGGVSVSPYESLNLGLHVNDDETAVRRNRAIMVEQLNLPAEPVWLNQTHSTNVCDGDPSTGESHDACWTDQPGRVLGVLTADCLPVVITRIDGVACGVAHAGWRGLSDGVVANLVRRFHCPVAELQVWLGPAIGPEKFEVGDDVLQHFVSNWASLGLSVIEQAFVTVKPGKWHANLYQLARLQLESLGVPAESITGGHHCTYTETERFFSYRRDGKASGRMLTLAWLPPDT